MMTAISSNNRLISARGAVHCQFPRHKESW
jgi:hypothetical protein